MVDTALGREEALALLREHLPALRERFGVSDLALFGSTARDEATYDSDVDVLVTFRRKPETSWGCYDAQSYLADALGRPVDMVERHRMRKEYLPWVEAEAVDPMNPRPLMANGSRPKRWDVYVLDMIKYCDELILFAAGLSYNDYLADARTQRATSFNLEHIGESANQVPKDVRDAHPEIDWGKMIGLRNRLVHAYYQINHEMLWQIIQDYVPELIDRLSPLLEEAQAAAEGSGE